MSDMILLFGDQTGEVLPSIEELNRHALRSPALRAFFLRCTDRLRASIARAPATYRRHMPTSFESPLELASWASSQTAEPLLKSSPALAAALLCISQLGHIIVDLEANPRHLDRKDAAAAQAHSATLLMGTCTGLLAAIAVACSDNLSALLAIADEVVNLAFHIGLEGVRRTAAIDDAAASTWATLVTNISDVAAVEAALADFNASSVLSADRQAYISARGVTPSVITISGPPSTTSALFAASSNAAPVFQGTKRIPLGISAAFHAPHLQPIAVDTVLQRCSVSPSLLARTLRSDMTLLSAGHGRRYEHNASFSAALAQALHDIFQEPIVLESAVTSLSAMLTAPAVTLVSFGPVNSTKAIARHLESNGTAVQCKANSTAASTEDSAASASLPAPPGDDAIAIVGMASRLPGSETLDEFWQVLEKGLDLHEPIRPDRFDVDSHCDPTGQRRNTSLTPYGVFIDRPGFFDTRLFNMSPREAAQTDPQQRLLLLTTYEALEMAGYAPDRTPSTAARRIGSFVGQTSDDYRDVNASQDVDTYFITGGIRAFGPGRLNYHFGWEGPSYSVDTACSSSAASIQLACTSLLSRECDTAVAGGANFLTASDLFAGLSRGSFLSKTGGCKTFDADADGYVRADAVAVIVLKRLSDAVADNDNILAVVRSAVTNHSAEAVSITHPHAATQERLFRAALNRAGLHPHDIDYAELHGTGTQAGDATESRSVTNVLAPGRGPAQPLYVGTVKPNLGHGEAASGITSLMKVILMLRNNAIPPHVGIKGRMNPKLPPFQELNTHIAFKKTPFLPRPGSDGKRRILINNFDAAGGNTSIIMEDAPAPRAAAIANSDPRSHHVIAVSGRTPNALVGNNQRLLDYVRKNPDTRLADLSYTTTARRMHQGLRQTHVAATLDGLVASLESTARDAEKTKKARAPASAPSVVFCFTGQGSQYAGMASELFASQPTFRETLLECDRISTSHGFESFLGALVSDSPEASLASASAVQIQLAIVSIELALAALWKSMGVTPAAVIGHSLGEYAALCTAGVLSLNDCLYLVGRRASLMLSKCTPGTQSMLALACGLDDAEVLLRSSPSFSSCEIACANSPSSTVISGPAAEVAELQKATSVKATLLDVQFAFHSAQLDPVMSEFSEYTAKAHYASPSIPFASTLFGTVVDANTGTPTIDGTYLVRQMRERVRFTDALESLLAEKAFQTGQSVWVETGPSPICLGLARSTFSSHALATPPLLLPSLKKGEGDWKMFAQAVAKAHEVGVKIDWQEYHAAFEPSLRLLELPSYAFDLKNYWIQYRGDWAIRKGDPAAEPASSAPPAKAPSFPAFTATTGLHRIESQVISDNGSIAVTFATDAIEPKLNRALRGHLVNGAGLCPSSVLGDMALTASNYIRRLSHMLSEKSGSVSPLSNDLCLDVHEMGIHKPLLIQPGDTKQTIFTAAVWDASTSTVSFTFSSQDGPEGAKQDHAHCKATFSDGTAWKALWKRSSYLVQSRMDQLVEAAASGRAHKLLRPMVYKLFASFVDYSEKYQGLQEVYMDSHQLEAAAKVKFLTNDSDGTFTCSPYWIDGFAHLSGFILNGADTTPADSVFISHGWGSMKFTCQFSSDKSYRSYVRMQEEVGSKGVFSGDVFFFEGDQVIAMCEDLKFQRVKRSILAYLLPSGAAPKRASQPITPPPSPTRKSVAAKTSSKAKLPASPKKAKASRNSLLFSDVLDTVASEVGIEVGELTDDAWFADLGVDSLLAISITARLSTQLGRHLPATLFTEYLSVSQLRTFFAGESSADDKPSASSRNDASWNTPPHSEPNSDDECSDTTPSPSPITSRGETPASSIGQTPEPGAANNHSAELFRKIIAQEVGVEASEIEDDTLLADLGVDSLLSLSILGTIKAQTGRVLPSSFLIDHPTLSDIQNVLGGQSHTSPQALAKAVEKVASHTVSGKKPAAQRKAEAILLQGSPAASSPSLFLLPDGSGSASSYVGLPSMGLKGAVYGLNSPFLKNPEDFSVPLQDVASMYADEIRRVQPEGPYHLGGWSIGGSYAFEVASQLAVRYGAQINSLILIDAPCPKTLPPLPAQTIDLLDKIGAFDGLKGRSSNKMRSGVRDHFAGSVNALKQYKPVPVPSHAVPKTVTVLWARDGVWETVGEDVRRQHNEIQGGVNAAEDWIMDPRKDKGPNGWETLLPGADIACKIVPGDHFTIMRRPGVTDLGEKLRCSVSE